MDLLRRHLFLKSLEYGFVDILENLFSPLIYIWICRFLENLTSRTLEIWVYKFLDKVFSSKFWNFGFVDVLENIFLKSSTFEFVDVWKTCLLEF